MATHEFSIPVSELDAAGKQYRFPLRTAWLRGVLEGHEASVAENDGELDLRASKSGHDVIVRGRLKADLVVPCARCLDPVELHLDQPVTALFVEGLKPPTNKDGEELEFSAEEADMHTFDGDTVVLDDLLRDELVLEIPMIPLCADNCPGISPPPPKSEPAAENDSEKVDPRLAPLLRFKKLQKE